MSLNIYLPNFIPTKKSQHRNVDDKMKKCKTLNHELVSSWITAIAVVGVSIVVIIRADNNWPNYGYFFFLFNFPNNKKIKK